MYISIEIFGNVAALFVMIGHAKLYFTIDSHGRLVIPSVNSASANPFDFEIDNAPDGRFTIKNAGLYLCAERDGNLTCNRHIAGGWEMFSFSNDLLALAIPDAQA